MGGNRDGNGIRVGNKGGSRSRNGGEGVGMSGKEWKWVGMGVGMGVGIRVGVGVGMGGNRWEMEALDGSSGKDPGSLGAKSHSLKYSNIWEQHPKKSQLRMGGEAPIKSKFEGEVSELPPKAPGDSKATSNEIFQQIPLIS